MESNGLPDYGILTQRFMSARQWDRSLGTAREWLGREPENLRAHRAAAQSLVNLERGEEAVRHLEKVLAGNPNDGFAHRLMAIVRFRAGQFRRADEAIRKAIELNPLDAYHWHQLAHMSYQQGDLATAKKCAERARELNPRDANILNQAILCEPDSPQTAANKIRLYEEALALDPENANIHNNIGVQHLNYLKDHARAEECFRRALFFAPTSRKFRQNLLVTLKLRDRYYRLLCTPKDWLYAVYNFFIRLRKKNLLLYILMIPLWLLAFRFVLGGLVLWFALVWPLTKVYEYLTVGDIRARAGELGVRRGGLLNYRRWPVGVRLGLFALILISFWGGVAFVCLDKSSRTETVRGFSAVLLGAGVVAALVYFGSLSLKNRLKARTARQRARQLEGVFRPRHREES